MLGTPNSGQVEYNDSTYRINQYYAGYIQDDWKVSQRLTLNLGLRYDLQLPLVERFNRVNAGFDFSVKNPLSDQIIARWRQLKAEYDAANPNARYAYPDPPAEIRGGKLFPGDDNRLPYDAEWWNIQPRFGFAWNFEPKTLAPQRPIEIVVRDPREGPPKSKHPFEHVYTDIRYLDAKPEGIQLYSMLLLEGHSRTILAGSLTPQQDVGIVLHCYYLALLHWGRWEEVISDHGGHFISRDFARVNQRLGIHHEMYEKSHPW